MRDGLYQITTKYFCAGYVVSDGIICECAPYLRKLFYGKDRQKWWAQAARVGN